MLPTDGSRQQRKQGKIHLFILAPSKALYSSSFRISCSPVCSFSLPATSHFVLILLVFAPHSFLNPKSLLPSQLALFNCSPCTSLLPTSSLFSCLSITSEHATSQHKPSYTPRMTATHLIFSPLSVQALLFFFVAPPPFFMYFLHHLLGHACSSVCKNI